MQQHDRHGNRSNERKRLALLVLLAGLAAGQASGAEPESLAIERVKIPDWARQATRMTFLAGEASLAAEAGAEIVQFNLIWPYYPLRRDGGGPPPDEAVKLRNLVDDIHRRGMKAVLGLPPFASVELVRAHPEWRIHADRSGSALRIEPKQDDLGTRNCCNNGPWGDYLIELLAELVEDFKLDGFSFDGNYHPPICYCPACSEQYQSERARPLPEAVDLAEVAYRRYLVWRGEKLEAHYGRMQARLKAIDRNLVIMTWTTNAGRYGHFLTSPRAMPTRLNLLFDLPMQEWWLDETNLGHTLMPAFGAAYLSGIVAGGPNGSEPYLMTRGNPFATDSFPAHERRARSMLAITHGSISLESLGWPDGKPGAQAVFEQVKRRAPYLTNTTRQSWAAMLVSEQTRQFYAWQDIGERFLPHAVGAFRVFQEAHRPLTLINDWDLTAEGLAPYALLVLPNSAALSDSQVAAIRNYVVAGGGLIASCETSLCNELGEPRKDFALADLFGVSYQGRPEQTRDRPVLDANFSVVVNEEYWRARVGAATLALVDPYFTDNRALNALAPGQRASFKGPLVRVSEPTAAAEVAVRYWPEGWKHDPLPAILVRSVSKGRVIYLAAGFDAAMWSYWTPFHRHLLTWGIDRVASHRPAITIEAPLCVQSGFYEQQHDVAAGSEAGVKRTVVHLYNSLDTSGGHGLPATEVPLREEAVPIGGMRMRFSGPPPKSVRVEPDAIPLELKREATDRANEHVVELPPLGLHYIVVVEH